MMGFMQRYLLILILLISAKTQASASFYQWSDSLGVDTLALKTFQLQNQLEERLLDYQDSDSVLVIKMVQLNLINQSRKKKKQSLLELDIYACRVANKMAISSAKNRYLSHWDLEGMKPYHRYGLNGGVHHVSENAHASWGNEKVNTSYENIIAKMNHGHSRFMAERRPNDGHKQTVLDPYHTHVGVGYGVEGDWFSYYEEYVDAYIDIQLVPNSSDQYTLKLKIPDSLSLVLIEVSLDPIPKSQTPQKLNRKGSYLDQGKVIKNKLWNDDGQIIRENEEISVNLLLKSSGLYYVQVYVTDRKLSEKVLTTKGSFPVSGVIIKKE